MAKRIFVIFSVLCIILAGANFLRFSTKAELTVWMLNVGQGESVLVKTADNHTLLFDGGPDDTVLSELGGVLPSWQRSIDVIVLSHPHKDHISGLISVMDRYEIGEIWTSGAVYNSAEYEAFRAQITRKHISEKHIAFPDVLALGETTINVIHPPQGLVGSSRAQPHDATVSIHINSSENSSVFLTGDLNAEHEEWILRHCLKPTCSIASDILQVPHHGSASGLEPDFLKAIHPSAALIPVGLKNFFRHPRPEVIAKLQEANIPIYRTDQDGRIQAVIKKDTCTVSAEKHPATILACGTSQPP